jgi:hypothetical protein
MDLQKFISAALLPREESIDVPELKEFFAADEKPIWTVRGLTAAELARANSSDSRGETMKALISAMAGNMSVEKSENIRKAFGLEESEVPQDVSRRIEMLTLASVSPTLGADQRDVAVKLAETFPTVFYNLTNSILNLTGRGAELGKQRRSGKTPA